MIPTREQTRTERRLAEVEALEQSLDQLAQELAAYKEVLQGQMEALRQHAETNHNPPAAAKGAIQRPRVIQQDEPPPKTDPPPSRQDSGVRRSAAAEVPPARPDSGLRRAAAEAPAGPARQDSGLRRGLAALATESEPVPLPGSGSRRRTPTPEPPPSLRQSDSGFRKTAAPLAAPQPTKKTDSGTRRGGKPISILISENSLGGEGNPITGWVIERTANTLRLLVDEQLIVGSVYSIRPAKDHPNAQWVQISVKSCVQERSSFAVLAQFVERPPWTALALL